MYFLDPTLTHAHTHEVDQNDHRLLEFGCSFLAPLQHTHTHTLGGLAHAMPLTEELWIKIITNTWILDVLSCPHFTEIRNWAVF